MIQAASVFLIVLSLSAVENSADEHRSECCDCVRTGQVVVALRSPVVSVGQLNASETGEADFRWSTLEKEHKWVYVVIHHSATESGSVESIHTEHARRKDSLGNPWLGIGYHFVIGNGSGMEDGQIEDTFRWKQQLHGAHSGSAIHNTNGIGICLIGNFENQKPSTKQMKAVTDLVTQLSKRYQIPARLVIGHNTVKPTVCSGKHFPLQDVRRDSVSDGRSDGSILQACSDSDRRSSAATHPAKR